MWPAAVERVAAFARAAGIEARLEQLPAGGATPAERADAVGCRLVQLVTTRVFIGPGEDLIAVLMPGDLVAAHETIARSAAVSCVRALEAGESEGAAGFPLDAMPPFPLPHTVALVERRVLAETLVWVCAGSAEHALVLSSADLVRAVRGRVVDLTRESA
jgi:prolyl-tRNA editing enzyme YbaK/EbsC (Cys-tRNA(Pro) deacylase)